MLSNAHRTNPGFSPDITPNPTLGFSPDSPSFKIESVVPHLIIGQVILTPLGHPPQSAL